MSERERKRKREREREKDRGMDRGEPDRKIFYFLYLLYAKPYCQCVLCDCIKSIKRAGKEDGRSNGFSSVVKSCSLGLQNIT